MKKNILIKNLEVFQGKKYLNTNKNYFEGWYFKNTTKDNGIAFIPGISINNKEKKAFIQIITNASSYYVNYDIEDFSFNTNPFYIKIKNNYFSKNKIHIDIDDIEQNITIYGDILYSNSKNINTNFFNPNIMGPFSYIPFMECNHAILTMKSSANGIITINNHDIKFNDGIGYIEKDWGSSFPKTYVWCQGNEFQNNKASFMLSIANIPFKMFHFQGFICTLIIDDKEYRFTTYNKAKILKYDILDNHVDITLIKGHYKLNIKSNANKNHNLIAPVKGEMMKNILESISANIEVTLTKDDLVIFSDTSINCGLEIV